MALYTDTHAHLDVPQLAQDTELVLKRAREAGVAKILCVGITAASTRRCIELARSFPAILKATAGIHPNACSGHGRAGFEEIKTLAAAPQVVAIGETGLDYHHDHSGRGLQETFFRRHIELAIALDKPLIIHGRRADEEILNILDDYPRPPRGIRHCFDSSAQVALEYVERGFYTAFGGLITKDGHKKLKKAASAVPAGHLLMETDSPYLIPAGAGGGRNEPANLPHIAGALAKLRGESRERIAALTSENAARLGLF